MSRGHQEEAGYGGEGTLGGEEGSGKDGVNLNSFANIT